MKGIMLKEDLFKKAIDGSKTQTRRIGGLEAANEILSYEDFDTISDTPEFHGMEKDVEVVKPGCDTMDTVQWKGLYPSFYIPHAEYQDCFLKPRYQLNEIVYLKEPFIIVKNTVYYKYLDDIVLHPKMKWKNKMFMPKRYARYFIKITNIRVERLYDISEQDAQAEGVEPGMLVGFGALGMKSYREGFFIKWITINGMKSFDINPFVFAYDFELFSPPQ